MKISYYLFFLTIILLSSLSSCTGVASKEVSNADKIGNKLLEDTIVTINPFCDSVYNREYRNEVERFDTIIDGKKYAYALHLAHGYILVSPQLSKKYDGMFEEIQILHGGKSFLISQDSSYTDYSEIIIPSPDKSFIFFIRYYETGRIPSEGYEVTDFFLKYSAAAIFDVKKMELVASFYSGLGVDGSWNYCNEWVENGKVLFDPNEE